MTVPGVPDIDLVAIPGPPNGRAYPMPAGARYPLTRRSLREDRTLLCVNNFIRLTDTIEHAGTRLPAMGPRFAEPLTDTVRKAASPAFVRFKHQIVRNPANRVVFGRVRMSNRGQWGRELALYRQIMYD